MGMDQAANPISLRTPHHSMGETLEPSSSQIQTQFNPQNKDTSCFIFLFRFNKTSTTTSPSFQLCLSRHSATLRPLESIASSTSPTAWTPSFSLHLWCPYQYLFWPSSLLQLFHESKPN